jgi:predicted kinase
MTPTTNHRPTLAIVNGRPGSGKTTLARHLAQALLCPLISRDEINEGIFHTYGHDLELAGKDRVARIAFDTFFRVIETFLSAGVTVVAEAAFQDHKWRIGLAPLLTIADFKSIRCELDPDLAEQRIARRRLEHRDRRAEQRAARARLAGPVATASHTFQPLSLPVPSLSVVTSDGYAPGLDEIVEFVTSG